MEGAGSSDVADPAQRLGRSVSSQHPIKPAIAALAMVGPCDHHHSLAHRVPVQLTDPRAPPGAPEYGTSCPLGNNEP